MIRETVSKGNHIAVRGKREAKGGGADAHAIAKGA